MGQHQLTFDMSLPSPSPSLRASLGEDAPFGVVDSRDGVAKRVGDGDLAAERVVGIGRFLAEGVNGFGDTALCIVDNLRRVAAAVGLRDLATERIVGVGGGYARGGTRRDGQAGLNGRDGRERRRRGFGRLDRGVGRAVTIGSRDGDVAEGIKCVGFGDKDVSVLNKRRGRHFPAAGQPYQASAGSAHERQFGRVVLARLPG